MSTQAVQRTVTRKSNPFAPQIKLRNRQLSQASPYVTLTDRAKPLAKNTDVVNAIKELAKRMGGKQFTQEHFGELALIDSDLIDINVDIQRLAEELHIAGNIIEPFDPRIMQPVNVIYIKQTGRYSAWDGQQSSISFWLMKQAGLIAPGVKIQCKVVKDDLTVPGSNDTGEAVGNYGFRKLNGNGRQSVDAFWTHRSRVNGVRRYNSNLREDRQSNEIQKILEQHNMFPAAKHEAQGRKALPGMVTYISGINQIAGHDTDDSLFEVTKTDLDWALGWHNRYFANEKGVEGGFILCFGRLHAESRGFVGTKKNPGKPAVPITRQLEDDLAKMIKDLYLTPKGFHEACKDRLAKWHKKHDMRNSWSDSCLTPFLVLDYLDWGGTAPIPEVDGIALYAGI